MRGSPLLRGLLVFLGVLLLAIPLRRLTSMREEGSGGRGEQERCVQGTGSATGTGGVVGSVAGSAGVRVGAGEGTPSVGGGPVGGDSGLEVVFDFSRGAKRLEVLHLGQVLLRVEGALSHEVRRLPLEFPREGVELLVRAEFEGEGISALRCRVKSPEGEWLERSGWGNQRIEEVLAFP
jgi:hypothetical protein